MTLLEWYKGRKQRTECDHIRGRLEDETQELVNSKTMEWQRKILKTKIWYATQNNEVHEQAKIRIGYTDQQLFAVIAKPFAFCPKCGMNLRQPFGNATDYA